MSSLIRAISLLACLLLPSCGRHDPEWFVADGRIATERVFDCIPLGKNIETVLETIGAAPATIKPVTYPDHPLELLRRLSRRGTGVWPRRKDVWERMHYLIKKAEVIPREEWRRFVFSYDYHSSLPPPERWQFSDSGIYYRVPLDGSHEVYLIRIIRVYRGMYSHAHDVYTGLLVSPHGIVVGKKLHISYARARGLQKAIFAEEMFLP